MSLAHNQSIVRAGLVLHVDPRNVKSYPGSGTTLTDISGNNIPITFVNPNANTVSISGGYLIFNPRNMKDDTNASYYIISDSRVAGLITAITIECWVYVSGLFSFQPRPVSSRISESSAPLGFAIANGSITYEINTTTVGWTGQYGTVFTSDCKQNAWCCIQQTTNDATKEFITYVNGIQVAKITYTGIPNTGGGYLLGRGFFAGINNFIGCIAAVKIYNRVLTADELLKNYEAQRYRYTNAIITDGLILNLDATNSSSYPGTGTTWYDITTVVGNGTIANAPTFTSGYSGYFTFNGSSHYANVPTPNLPYGAAAGTICGWATTSTIAAGYHWIFSYGTPINTQSRFIGIYGNTFCFGGYGNDITAIGVPLNTWFHIVGVYDGTTAYLYVNGVLLASAAKTWNTLLSTAQLGRQTNTGEYWNGNISQLQCYNRALSATEVLQNYNVSRGLYTTGIVNDALVLSLDAGITTSYPGSGTTWTDLSGYSNNATMYGSVPFATDVAPCFDFASVTGATTASASLGFTFASNMVATTGSFTFSCWVKNPNGTFSQISLFNNAGGGDGYRFGISTAQVYALIGPSYTELGISFLATMSTTAWHYVNCVYDRAGTLNSGTPQFQVYLDGVFQNNAAMPATQTATQNGAPGIVRANAAGSLYTGKLAAFTVHNKALSSTEITQNFNAQRGRYGV